jgi:hypothetical protein
MNYTRIHSSHHHQLFLNEHGEVVIADQSGDTPDQTDDGPLIVAPDAEVLVTFGLGGLLFRVTVLVALSGSDTNFVSMNLTDFRALHKQLPGLRIDGTNGFLDFHAKLQEAWLMIYASKNGISYVHKVEV